MILAHGHVKVTKQGVLIHPSAEFVKEIWDKLEVVYEGYSKVK
jgi:hypothetical protein